MTQAAPASARARLSGSETSTGTSSTSSPARRAEIAIGDHRLDHARLLHVARDDAPHGARAAENHHPPHAVASAASSTSRASSELGVGHHQRHQGADHVAVQARGQHQHAAARRLVDDPVGPAGSVLVELDGLHGAHAARLADEREPLPEGREAGGRGGAQHAGPLDQAVLLDGGDGRQGGGAGHRVAAEGATQATRPAPRP